MDNIEHKQFKEDATLFKNGLKKQIGALQAYIDVFMQEDPLEYNLCGEEVNIKEEINKLVLIRIFGEPNVATDEVNPRFKAYSFKKLWKKINRK